MKERSAHWTIGKSGRKERRLPSTERREIFQRASSKVLSKLSNTKLMLKSSWQKQPKKKGEADEKTSKIASILQSEILKQIKFATGTKPTNPTVTSSKMEFASALGSFFKSKDKSK